VGSLRFFLGRKKKKCDNKEGISFLRENLIPMGITKKECARKG
jgi:hypothetical protein